MTPQDTPAILADLVRQHRRAASALRRLNIPGPGRVTHGSTMNAIKRHRVTLRAIQLRLGDTWGRYVLAGLVKEEAELVDRITECRRNGVPRPELSSRLATCRIAIRNDIGKRGLSDG